MEITDSRTVVDFQKTTFCGHLRSHVIKVLIQNIQLGHADYACYWTLELLCSGLTHTLWMVLFEAAALHINRANPNVFLYLEKAYEKFAPIERPIHIREMTTIRNHPDARKLVCEVASTLAMCRKNKLQSLPVIKPVHDFDSVTIQESLKAPSTLYGKIALRKDDPLAVVVPINEFCYCLRQDIRDVTRALYWMAWVYGYAREFKKQSKTKLLFANRSDEFVAANDGDHVAWLFWDCIRKQAGSNVREHINALYRMYCLRWSPGDAKSRQPLLTAAVVLVCEGVSLDTTPVVGDTLSTSTVLNGIPGWIDAISRTQKSFSSEMTK